MAITPKMVQQRLPYVWRLFEKLRTNIALSDPYIIFIPAHIDALEMEQIKSAFSCLETLLALESEFGFHARLVHGQRIAAFHMELYQINPLA